MGSEMCIRDSFDSQYDLVLTGTTHLIHDTGRPESAYTSLPNLEFVDIVNQLRRELISKSLNVVFESEHSILSNLSATPFVLDGRVFGSVEGFIQSLKYPLGPRRDKIERLAGYLAQRAGKNPNEKIRKSLSAGNQVFLQLASGTKLGFQSAEHLEAIERAILAKFTQNSEALSKLKATQQRPLTHTLTRPDLQTTWLTPKQFCRILFRIRKSEISSLFDP